jgi:hypothetical protein
MKVKVKRVRGGSMGDQRNYGLVAGSIWNYEDKPTTNQVNDVLSPVPEDEATIEAERNETIVYPNNEGNVSHAIVGGKRHSEGGTPLNVPDGSFVFSDTRSLRIKNKDILKGVFDYNTSKSVTPAQVAKRYELNKYFEILKDPEADYLDKKTAQMMIDNNLTKLGQLALVQEGMKGFPDGIPDISKPLFEKDMTMQQPAQENPRMKFGGQIMRKGGRVLPRHQKKGPVTSNMDQGFGYTGSDGRAYYVQPNGVITDIQSGSTEMLSPEAYQQIVSSLVQAGQQGQLASAVKMPGQTEYMPYVNLPEVNVRPDITLPGGTEIPRSSYDFMGGVPGEGYVPANQGTIYDSNTRPWWDPAYQAYANMAYDPNSRSRQIAEALGAGAVGTAAVYGAAAAAPYATGVLNTVANAPLIPLGETAFTVGDLANAGFLANAAYNAPQLGRDYRDVFRGTKKFDTDLVGRTGEFILGASSGFSLGSKFAPMMMEAAQGSKLFSGLRNAENVTLSAGLPAVAAPSAENIEEGEGSMADYLNLMLGAGYLGGKYLAGTKLSKSLYPDKKKFAFDIGDVTPLYVDEAGRYISRPLEGMGPSAIAAIRLKNGEIMTMEELAKLPASKANKRSLLVGENPSVVSGKNPNLPKTYEEDLKTLDRFEDEMLDISNNLNPDSRMSMMDVFKQANPSQRKRIIDAWNAKLPEQPITNYNSADPDVIEELNQKLGNFNFGEYWQYFSKNAYMNKFPAQSYGVQYQSGKYRSPLRAGLSTIPTPDITLPSWLKFPKLEGNWWQKAKTIAGSGLGDAAVVAGLAYGVPYLQQKARQGSLDISPSNEGNMQSTVMDPSISPVYTTPVVSSAPLDSMGTGMTEDIPPAPVETSTPPVNTSGPRVNTPAGTTQSSAPGQMSDDDLRNMILSKGYPPELVDSVMQEVRRSPATYVGNYQQKTGGSVFIYDPIENTMTDIMDSFADGGENGLPKHQTGPEYDIKDEPFGQWLENLAKRKNFKANLIRAPYAAKETGVGSQTASTGYTWSSEGTLVPVIKDASGRVTGQGDIYSPASGWKGVDSQIEYLKANGINFGEYGTAGGDEAEGIKQYKEDIRSSKTGDLKKHQAANRWVNTQVRSINTNYLLGKGFTMDEIKDMPELVDASKKGAWNYGKEIAGTQKFINLEDVPPPPPVTTPPPPPSKCKCKDPVTGKETETDNPDPTKPCPPCPPNWKPTDRPGGGWSPFALANLYGAIGQRPYVSQNPPFMQAQLSRPEYVLKSHAQEIQNIKGAQQQASREMQSVTADPSVLRANLSKLAGQSMEAGAKAVSDTDTYNIGVINQNLPLRSEIANKELAYNQQNVKDYIEGVTTLGARAAQDKARKNAQVMAALKYGQDEARNVDFQNIANAKNYYYDNTTGTVRFMPGYFEGTGQGNIVEEYNQMVGPNYNIPKDDVLKLLQIKYGSKNAQNSSNLNNSFNPTGNPWIQ